MTSHPLPVDDYGVELLLGQWGGEGVYFWLKDEALVELVKRIGRARVIEVAVPIRITRNSLNAAEAVVATLVKSCGCEPDWPAFSVYATETLGPEAVLRIHTEDDPDFLALARGYPAEFVNRERSNSELGEIGGRFT